MVRLRKIKEVVAGSGYGRSSPLKRPSN